MALYRQSKVLVNFHEWLTTVGLIFLQDWKVPAATVYRPHDPIEKNDPSKSKDAKTLKKGEKKSPAELQPPKVEVKLEKGTAKKSTKEFQPKNLVKAKATNFENGKTNSFF